MNITKPEIIFLKDILGNVDVWDLDNAGFFCDIQLGNGLFTPIKLSQFLEWCERGDHWEHSGRTKLSKFYRKMIKELNLDNFGDNPPIIALQTPTQAADKAER